MNHQQTPNFEKQGYFEGSYDYIARLGITPAEAALQRYMPVMPRFDLLSARPELSGFEPAIDKELPGLTFPYNQMCALKQIGRQYYQEGKEADGVPDAYSICFARTGSFGKNDGGSRRHDQTKSLYVDVMRAEAAAAMIAGTYDYDMTALRWQKVAARGQQFGNAVLAFSKTIDSSYPILHANSVLKRSDLKPVTSKKLAQAVFETVYYW